MRDLTASAVDEAGRTLIYQPGVARCLHQEPSASTTAEITSKMGQKKGLSCCWVQGKSSSSLDTDQPTLSAVAGRDADQTNGIANGRLG